ncbi:lactonase family protein [Flavilitoribacter nigricans]|nr:lactonase family protein [Flavilitoribacter nigricans]
MQAFVGTYTRKEGHVDGKAKGIYQISADTSDGQLFRVSTVPNIVNPSYVIYSPDGKYLYAASEIGGGTDSTGYVYAYSLSGEKTQLLNRQMSHGLAPCHLAVHPSGKYLFVANYMGGIAVYPIQDDGSLLPASDVQYLEGSGPHARQEASHPHSVTIDREGRFAYVADLGTDKIMIFLIDQNSGKLEPAATPFAQVAPGAGPRHLTFHPNGQLLYAINELNSTITAFSYDRADGHLQALQTVSTLPMDFTGDNTCADIHIEPGGRYLYGSNRGHNSIALFEIDDNNGEMTPKGHQSTSGEVPRNFAIDPYGKFLYAANQNSDNIVYFRINPASGRLEPIGELNIPTPVCIQFEPVRPPS